MTEKPEAEEGAEPEPEDVEGAELDAVPEAEPEE